MSDMVTLSQLMEDRTLSLQTGPFGTQLHSHDYVEEGVPVIPTEGIQRGRIDHSVLPKISIEKSDELKRHKVLSDDILFARRGAQATGRTARIRRSEEGFICGTGAIRARILDQSIIDPVFLAWYLAAPSTVAWIREQAIGATMPNLNKSIIGRIEIPILSISEQKEIAALLAALDDKIELNRRMSATLEEMARALYRSWFVDFDPVHARALGQLPAHMDATIAALFPDSFGPDGLPKGWEIAEIGQELLILDSKRVPLSKQQRQKRQGAVPYYGATSIMDYVDDYIFDDVLLLVGEDGSVVKPDGKPFTQYIWGKSWVNNHAHVLKGKKFSVEQLKCFFETVSIAEFITGAVQLKLNQGNMKKIPWVKAADTIHYAFDEVIKPWHTKIRLLEDETQNLAALRGTLLPRLMSGELRIREAEKQAEAMV